MLKTCNICGRIHDFNKVCKRTTNKKTTGANNFRKSYQWTQKSKEIRERDNNLCQVCITNKYSTQYRYNYNDLEVHHIIPLAEQYDMRLDSTNLITLCRYHHEMAESGQITREELKEIVTGKYR